MGSPHKDNDREYGALGMNSMILAIETSSRVGSVALAQDSHLWDHTAFSAPMRHSAEILPTIARLLHRFGRTPGDIDQVHISIGPGSFTGLRIAVTIAKSMHLANSSRIVAVDALDVIAANIHDAADSALFQTAGSKGPCLPRIATLLDAKRGQFFVAVYECVVLQEPSGSQSSPAEDDPGYHIAAPGGAIWRKVQPDCLMSASAFLDKFSDPNRPIGLLGDGLLYHQDKFRADGICIADPSLWGPRAANVHLLGYQKAQAGLFADPLTLVPFYLRGPQVTLKARC